MAETVKIIWVDSTSPGVTNYKIYRDGAFLASVGIGVQTYDDSTAMNGLTYKYTVQAVSAVGESVDEVLNGNMDFITISYALPTNIDAVVQVGDLIPVLTNFRVEDANKDRVYFDTPLGYPDGMTTTGFVIGDRTISGVTKVSDTQGYFTISTSFDFWDNDMIRLGENNASSHSQSVIYNFTLEKIQNNIPEPDASTYRYVSPSGSGDGTSIGSPASLFYAFTNAQPGQTWWIKKGQYNVSSALEPSNSGTATSPIKFVGYKDFIGDISGMYWNDGDSVDSNQMPFINGTGSGYGTVTTATKSNIIYRNIQATNASGSTFKTAGCTELIFDNVLCYNTSTYGMLVWFASSNTIWSERIRITGCKMDGGQYVTWLAAKNSLLENSDSYSSSNTSYMLNHEGHYNIIRSSDFIRSTDNPSHTGHGINFNRVNGNGCTYSLAVDCQVMNCDKSVEFRKSTTNNCVVRNIHVFTDGTTGTEDTGGLVFRDGADNCIAESCTIDTSKVSNSGAIRLEDSVEDGNTNIGDNNIIRNSVFKNSTNLFAMSTAHTTSTITGFKFINNTVDNINRLMWTTLGTVNGVNCEFKNSMISNVTTKYQGTADGTGWTFDSNNWHSNGFAAFGTNITEIDPQYDNEYNPGADFSSITATKQAMVPRDFLMDARAETTTRGYKKSSGESGGVIPPPTPDYLLDKYAAQNPTHGFSFFKLKSTATKSCEVKRLSDNTFTDVLLHDSAGLTLNSEVSAGGTLGAWLGSSNMEFAKFYNQTGGTDWGGDTAYNPDLATAGALLTDSSGFPAPRWNGTTRNYMDLLSLPTLSSANMYIRGQHPVAQAVWFQGDGGGDYLPIGQDSNSSDGFQPSAIGSNIEYYVNGTSIAATRQGVYTNMHNGVANLMTIINADLTQGGFAKFRLGRYGAGFDFVGNLSELIIFSSDTSSVRTNIETDITNRY